MEEYQSTEPHTDEFTNSHTTYSLPKLDYIVGGDLVLPSGCLVFALLRQTCVRVIFHAFCALSFPKAWWRPRCRSERPSSTLQTHALERSAIMVSVA